MLAWAVICFAVFLIGLTKSGLGGGMGLIVVPMTAIALAWTPLGSEAALGLLLPLLIAGDLLSIGQYRKVFDFSKVKPLLIPTAAGVILGSLLLWWIHKQENQQLISTLMRLEIGLESIFLVSLYWWRQYMGMQQKLMSEPARSIVTGTFTGVSTTLAHAAGPIIAAYLLPLKLDRRVFVGTTAVFFFLANTSKLPTYYMAGLFDRIDWRLTLKLLPLVILGAACGFWLVKRLTDQSYFRFIYGAVFAVGWYLVIESMGRLVGLI
ncbi:MAG: sulfite exporter TauE/SafE family protein [Burkholderiales bacterium]|nr:sulfite exporter TauE/SafE family protein [Phycisphaerae bacterium]